MKKIFLFATITAIAFTSCKKDNDKKDAQKIFKGEAQTFQHGKAWTWYEVDEQNKPLRIAIAIDDAAMNSLERPSDMETGHQHASSLSLQFDPRMTAGTPFTHALLDWNPMGHEPGGIYDKPHFDFHFYTISEAERLSIPTYEQAKAKFDNYPDAAYYPPTYMTIPGGVPQMGAHWFDTTTPELNGQPFTQTFLYGSYDGKVAFYEPMITEAFIKANPSFERPIPVATKFKTGGWYPTKMRISKENGATNVILEGFVKRNAS